MASFFGRCPQFLGGSKLVKPHYSQSRIQYSNLVLQSSGVPRNFVRGGGGGGSTNAVEDRGQRERGSGGGSPLVRSSGGSCNLVQEISFHIENFLNILVF